MWHVLGYPKMLLEAQMISGQIPKWHLRSQWNLWESKRMQTQQTKSLTKRTLANALQSTLRGWFFPTMQFLKCVLSVCELISEFWKVPMAPQPLRPQDVACHCGIFSPSESPLESICQSSFSQTFGLLWLHFVGVSEVPLRSQTSLRNLARNHLAASSISGNPNTCNI